MDMLMIINCLHSLRALFFLATLITQSSGADLSPKEIAEHHLAQGLTCVHRHQPQEALPHLEKCLSDLEGDERRASVQRLIGHIYSELGHLANVPDQQNKLFDQASARYAIAADGGDQAARHFYLTTECRLSADRGYIAGWRYLAWNGAFALDGWYAIIGNYGAVMTQGQGLVGLWKYHPMHAVVWSVFIVIFLSVALSSWLSGRHKATLAPPLNLKPNIDASIKKTPTAAVRTPANASVPRASASDHAGSASRPSPLARSSGISPARIPPNFERLRQQHRTKQSQEKSKTEFYDNTSGRTPTPLTAEEKFAEKSDTSAIPPPVIPRPPSSRPR